MMKKAQINMVFTFIAALLLIGAIVLIATKMLGGTISDKCVADRVVFADKFQESIRTNNDYGGVNRETFLAPCSYKTICLVDARAIDLDNGAIPGGFRINAKGFPGETLIRDSVLSQVETNIFLVDLDGMVIDAGFSPQLELYDPENVTCITARQGKFTFVFKGQGRTTLVNAT